MTAEKSHKSELALERWAEKLSGSGLPAFARTVREISSVASDRASSARDLSDVVSQDAAIAARLIHISNSSLFNVSTKPIDTISSAIVRIGFDAVKELALSVSIIDSIMRGKAHEHLGGLMGHAFHAAAQAKSIAVLKGEKAEEIFVGALLRDVGAMAFWSRGEEVCDELALLLATGIEPTQAEADVLGFSLGQLSAALAKDWDLGELCIHANDLRYADNPRFACMHLGHQIADALEREGIEQEGWGHNETSALLKQIAKEHQIDAAALFEICEANYEVASALADKLGIKPVALPEPSVADMPDWSQLQERQAELLQELAEGIENQCTRDELMTQLISGLTECFTAEDAYFALSSADRTRLIVKYASGPRSEQILGAGLVLEDSQLFKRALSERKAFISQTHQTVPWHAGGQALLAGIHIAGKAVGALYLESRAILGAKEEASFRQFVQQVALILTQAA